MKRISNFSKILLLFCFSLMLSAFNAGSTINNTLIVPYAYTEPTIDGVEDSTWTFPQVGCFAYTDNQSPDSGPGDISGWFKMTWDYNNLYWFVHVADDSIDISRTESWMNDCVEIFIDGHDDDNIAYDSNDVQWRAVTMLEGDTLVQCWNNAINLRPPYYTLAWTETSVGYDMEIGIPDSGLRKQLTTDGTVLSDQILDLNPGTVFGFELHLNDSDDSSGSHIGARWWDVLTPYTNPSQMGTVILGGDLSTPILQIPQISNAPLVNGDLDAEWVDTVPEVAMSVGVLDGTTLMFPDSGKPDLTGFFRAAWNEDGFYFFARVVDDSISVSSTLDHENDGFEIYFDGDNSKGTTYDGYDDIQWRFVYGQDSATQGPGPSECEAAWQTTADGYTFELALPATTLSDTNITLALGNIMGFEVQLQDNDGGTPAREGIAKWWDPTNLSWQQPALFGTAVLAASNGGKVPEGPVAGNIALSVPAVLTSAADISYSIPARSSVKLSLINLAGQVVDVLVNEAQSAGTYTASINADLANGVYFCKLDACGETATDKVLLIK